MVGKWFLLVFTTAMMGLAWLVGVEPMTRGTTTKSPFVELKMEKLGNHTYYSESMFTNQNAIKNGRETVLEQMRIADANLEYDVYVTGFNSMYGTEDFRMYGLLITDGVPNNDFSITSGFNPETGKVDWVSHRYGLLSLIPAPKWVDRLDMIPVEEAFRTAMSLAEENKHTMFRLRKEEPIRGTWMVKCDAEGNVFFDFVINDFSSVWIDGKTGEVLRAYFWNGIYED